MHATKGGLVDVIDAVLSSGGGVDLSVADKHKRSALTILGKMQPGAAKERIRKLFDDYSSNVGVVVKEKEKNEKEDEERAVEGVLPGGIMSP